MSKRLIRFLEINPNKYELEQPLSQIDVMSSALQVLYLDERKDLLYIGKRLLEEFFDFFVTTTPLALRALVFLNKENFDAVISEYLISRMNGIRFLIKLLTKFGQIPVILFSRNEA